MYSEEVISKLWKKWSISGDKVRLVTSDGRVLYWLYGIIFVVAGQNCNVPLGESRYNDLKKEMKNGEFKLVKFEEESETQVFPKAA